MTDIVNADTQQMTSAIEDQKRRTPANERHLIHGESRTGDWTPEYRAWASMLGRCYRATHPRFKDYGGRGITVCDEWRRDVLAFIRDVGRRPSLAYSLDRFPDTNGPYKKDNVRWATRKEQSRNKRSNVVVTAFSLTMTLVEWAEKSGLPYKALSYRLRYGWAAEEALSQPIGSRMGRRRKAKA